MTRETYKGRKLKVVKNRESGGLVGSINGQAMPASYGISERQVIEQFRRDIDLVDRTPVNGGYGAYMYAPGTYELCENDHVKIPGESCRHSYCVSRAGTHERAS